MGFSLPKGLVLNLDEATTIVTKAIRNYNSTDYPNVDIYRAILSVGNAFVQDTRCVLSDGSITLSADVAAYDFSSITDMRPEDVEWVELAYVDQGTWATATSYVVNDLVKGDGSPDALLYVCTEDHTSGAGNEPGTSGGEAVWTQVNSKLGWGVDLVDTLESGVSLRSFNTRNQWPYNTADPQQYQSGPNAVSFRTLTECVVSPVPDARWTLRFYYYAPFTDFDPDSVTPATQSLNIPERYIRPMLRYGVAAEVMRPTPENMALIGMYEAKYNEHVMRTAGQVTRSPQQIIKDPGVYA